MLSDGKFSCCILTEINPEFWSRPNQQKQILTGLLVTRIYKNRAMKIYLFNYSMLGYLSPITTSLPIIYRRKSCATHIFKPTHQTWLQASMRFTPGPQLQRKLNYAKCLVSDVVSNAQNRALKKLKMDSNSRYSPGHIIKGDKKRYCKR